jgi:hypothetical protein
MSDSEPFGPAVLKHLDYIEAVIARLAGNSFLIKGWAITVAGAIYGFAVHDADWRLALVGVIPALTFWLLDGFFLRQEWRFRSLYDAVRDPQVAVDPFSMDPQPYAADVGGWLHVARSRTLAWLYGPLLGAGLLLTLVLAFHR